MGTCSKVRLTGFMGFGAQEGAPSRPRKAFSQGPKVCYGVEAFGFRV